MSVVTQSCPTLCDPMDCSPPGSSIHGILQAEILWWAAIPLCKESSQTRDRTQSPVLQADSLPSEPSEGSGGEGGGRGDQDGEYMCIHG